MTKVYSPNKKFNGKIADVTFIKGYGETDSPYLLDYFKRKGFTIEKEITVIEPIEEVKVKVETPKKTRATSNKGGKKNVDTGKGK